MEVVVQCDVSQHGLGARLMQNGQPLAYASRSPTPAESKYVQIEKELLARVFGVEKFESYVYVKRFKPQATGINTQKEFVKCAKTSSKDDVALAEL